MKIVFCEGGLVGLVCLGRLAEMSSAAVDEPLELIRLAIDEVRGGKQACSWLTWLCSACT